MIFNYDLNLLLIISGSLFLGGIVKGISGVGLPIISIAILVNFFSPHVVLAIVVVPIIITNFWQGFRSKNIKGLLTQFAPMISCFIPVLTITAYLVVDIDVKYLFATLGISFSIFSISNLVRPPPFPLSTKTQKWLAPLAGIMGGLLGGVSTIWGPPLMMYLVLMKLPKDAFVQVVGLIWSLGSLPLAISYWANGMINNTTLPLSIYACFPGMLGIFIGELFRKRISQETFRRFLMIILLIIGINLIRRALI